MVAEIEDLFDLPRLDVGGDPFQGGDIPVDVGNDSKFSHGCG
jgi:hypothetical protein